MSWFTKVETAEVVIQHTPLELFEQNRNELRVLDEQLREAEKAIMEHCRVRKDPRVRFIRRSDGIWNMHAALNAATLDPQLQKLDSNRADILRRRGEKLVEHGQLKKAAGLATY